MSDYIDAFTYSAPDTPWRIPTPIAIALYLYAGIKKILAYSAYLRNFFALMAALVISGCGSLTTPMPADVTARQLQRHYADNITLSGRILVRYRQNDEEKSLSGSYEWQQSTQQIKVTLLSPLGQTIATITQNATGAILQQANQPPRYAQDVDALLEANLGWSLPLQGLRDWLQGYLRDADGKLQAVASQDGTIAKASGWQLQFVSWQQAKPILPRRIDLQRGIDSTAGQGAGVSQLSLRILIDQWELPQ